MMALSVAYQQERPNVEAADIGDLCRPTTLVIRAMGLILGKMIREEGGIGGVGGIGGIVTKRYFVLTKTITSAAQAITEVQELDIDLDFVNSRRLGHIIKKLRLIHTKQPRTGNRGWMISLEELFRWSKSYGLDIEEITGIPQLTQYMNATNATNAANATPWRASCERAVAAGAGRHPVQPLGRGPDHLPQHLAG
jgi:hypothetical protein